MDIQLTRPALSTRVFTLDELSKRERNTLRNIQNDVTHNVYFTPGVASLLAKQGVTTSAKIYDPETRTKFYPAAAPVNDKGLLNAQGQIVLYAMDVLTTAAPQLLAQSAPNVAAHMSEVNIVIGVAHCLDKLSYTARSKRVGGAFCMADILVRTLLLLGNYIPPLQKWALGLISVQMLIKVGDKWEEIKSSARAEQGRAILQGVQASALAASAPVWPVNGVGVLASNSTPVLAPAQKPPPAM
jgi:hypothetical protein